MRGASWRGCFLRAEVVSGGSSVLRGGSVAAEPLCVCVCSLSLTLSISLCLLFVSIPFALPRGNKVLPCVCGFIV